MRFLSTAALTHALLLASATAKPSTPGQHSQYNCTHSQPTTEIEALYLGNRNYINSTNSQLLYDLAHNGQEPPFMLVDCSDSRVNEQGIFSAQPGTLFTAGNIANQFSENDLNSNAVLAYAVETLRVKHVIVLGHYGCGGVAASMTPLTTPVIRPADIAVNAWITPIRQIYMTSVRPEIVAHRNKAPSSDLPHLHDPAFRAMVEENVKANVERIAKSAVMQDHYTSLAQSDCPSKPEVYIHGWVYDIENGVVSDLGVSAGPPGKDIPKSPFPPVKS